MTKNLCVQKKNLNNKLRRSYMTCDNIVLQILRKKDSSGKYFSSLFQKNYKQISLTKKGVMHNQ